MDPECKKIEAVLFTTGRFMSIEEIAGAAGFGSVGFVKEKVEELQRHYDAADSAICVVNQDDRWKLNIKKEFGFLANKLAATSEFDAPTTKTLAVIAYRHPAVQSDIIKIRGNKAYDHIGALQEQGLLTSEKSGRTRLLKLTPKFYDYFDTADVQVKQIFKSVEDKVKKEVAERAGLTPEQVVEKEKVLEEYERKTAEMKARTQEQHQKEDSSSAPDPTEAAPEQKL